MLQTQPTTIENRITDLLAQMTLAEKVGQMTQVSVKSIAPDEIAARGIGSILSGGGENPTPNTPKNWAMMVRDCQGAALRSRLGIPLLYGADCVHGHNNVRGATIFPHNIGLGATRNAALVEKVARMTALEILATNVHWNFAPTVAVPQDIRWGRTYEGFSEDPTLVSELGVAYLRGLQNPEGTLPLSHPHAVLGSVKHFIGDGGTTWGTTPRYEWISEGAWYSSDDPWSIDQGDTRIDEASLRQRYLPPYVAAIEAGARNIMVSYSSWNGVKMHAQKYLLTDVLKGELGFDGFLISDWLAINQITSDYYTCVVTSINAGLDMIMVPFDYERFITALTRAVEQGDVPIERIDDAVRRILRVKLELGLFEQTFGDESLLVRVGSAEHRAVAREAVRQSLVLLKNDNETLPLSKDTPSIFVAGQAADDIGLQCGGWTIEHQGQSENITPGTTLLAALLTTVAPETNVYFDPTGQFDASLDQAKLGLLVISEPPYAEGFGDRASLNLMPDEVALINRIRTRCEKLVLILYSGRPLIVTDILPQVDGLVAAWLPGTEGQGIADVLFGEYPFTGKLPYTWPRSMAQVPLAAISAAPLFPFGFHQH